MLEEARKDTQSLRVKTFRKEGISMILYGEFSRQKKQPALC